MFWWVNSLVIEQTLMMEIPLPIILPVIAFWVLTACWYIKDVLVIKK